MKSLLRLWQYKCTTSILQITETKTQKNWTRTDLNSFNWVKGNVAQINWSYDSLQMTSYILLSYCNLMTSCVAANDEQPCHKPRYKDIKHVRPHHRGVIEGGNRMIKSRLVLSTQYHQIF